MSSRWRWLRGIGGVLHGVLGGDGNEQRRRRRKLWRGRMDRGELLGESRHEEVARGGSRQAGGVAFRPAGSVAFHRAAWGRGTRKKTLVPLWAGWAGVGRLRLGDR